MNEFDSNAAARAAASPASAVSATAASDRPLQPDTRLNGVPMINDALQLIFTFGDLKSLGRSAQVCRFFRSNVDQLFKQLATFKVFVHLLKTEISIFADIKNMFDSSDAPAVLRTRYELITRLVAEEKQRLAQQGAATSSKRVLLRDFSTRYAELGDIDHAIALLLETDLCSLASLAQEQDAYTKSDRLRRIVGVLGEVINFARTHTRLLSPQTLEKLSLSVAQTLAMIEPLRNKKFGQYSGFDQLVKEDKKTAAHYATVRNYTPIAPVSDSSATSAVTASAASSSSATAAESDADKRTTAGISQGRK